MNPSTSDYQPNMELPAITPEAGTNNAPLSTEASRVHAETAAGQMELPAASPLPAQPPSGANPLPIIDPSLQVQPQGGQPGVAGAASSSQSPAIADDLDIIEKEWVIKAKAIVAQTKEDPHLQNKEINKFKADYVKKRYNKELKVAQD